MSMFNASVPQTRKMLLNLDTCIAAAVTHAETVGFDPDNLFQSRLAPDQFTFGRQIQSACDAAKALAARLSGQTPPSHPDTEKTLGELRARIATVVAYLDTFSEADFEGAADRIVVLPFIPGKGLKGSDYLNEMALPNFYFHATTAYAILRHNGVQIGKRHFIGSLNLLDV